MIGLVLSLGFMISLRLLLGLGRVRFRVKVRIWLVSDYFERGSVVAGACIVEPI